MKVGVYLNLKYEKEQKEYLSLIYSEFAKHSVECLPVTELSVIKKLDVLLVLGGDGTILTIASECASCGVKILGVNYGHLGFLTDFERNQLKQALDLIIGGNFETVKRSMLEIQVYGKTYFALNEAVVQRCTTGNAYSNTVNLSAAINNSTVDNFCADGLIVSTPTGSTAYSLSAGGSILTPNLNAFIITPICPHSLHSRPIVFNDSSVVEICQSGKNTLNLVVDGRVVETVKDETSIVIKKADRYAEFISVAESNFFDKLLIKLNIWSK